MGHYTANVRDLEFNLFELFHRQDLFGDRRYPDLDITAARDMLREMARLAENELASSFQEADRTPPTYHPATYSVELPAAFRASYQAYLDAEWWRTVVPTELGGIDVPASLSWALAEMVLGANPGVHLYAAGFGFSRVLYQLGTPAQKKLAQHLVDQRWGGTMVLTEPDAGSDVGAGRATATQRPDGTWHLNGVKRFITSAEADIYHNIVHFVLARPEGAGPGTKGLSLFIVPKFHVDLDTGELGERNGVFVTNVERKMGIKVSTTCEVRFGEIDDIPAVGTLLGDVHDGIAQMFTIIESARMMVGTKAIATLSTGYLAALEFAKTRVQGPDLTRMADKTAPRVTITHHPDIRRSLMLQKAYAEGLRALVLFAASQQDVIEQGDAPAEKINQAVRLNDLLLPLVKGCGSERAWVLLGTESLQTLGGSGFLQDYPLEQYVRDAKIDTLYEGTTAIQGLDFFFRKIVRDRGQTFDQLTHQIREFAKGGEGDLTTERELLGHALDDVQAIVGSMVAAVQTSEPRPDDATDPLITRRALYTVGQNTTRLLLCAGDLIVGWLLLRQSEVAHRALTGEVSTTDRAFYTGKIAAAAFFARTILPRISAERAIAEATDNALMDVPEDAF